MERVVKKDKAKREKLMKDSLDMFNKLPVNVHSGFHNDPQSFHVALLVINPTEAEAWRGTFYQMLLDKGTPAEMLEGWVGQGTNAARIQAHLVGQQAEAAVTAGLAGAETAAARTPQGPEVQVPPLPTGSYAAPSTLEEGEDRTGGPRVRLPPR